MNYLEKQMMIGILLILLMLIWGGKSVFHSMVKYPLAFIGSVIGIIILFSFL